MIRNHSRHGSRFPITLGGGGGYSVAKSLRFRASASAYLNRTPTTTGSRTTFTWSGWVKRGALGTGIGNRRAIFSSGRTDGSPQNGLVIRFFDDQISVVSGGGVSISLVSSAVYRDPAAWYHLVLAVDSTQGTASNRVKIYVNGEQITSFGTSTYPSASQNFDINTSAYVAYNGVENDSGTLSYYYDGEMAEVNFVDGLALAPTAFGAFSTYNQWLPKAYTGTYGTNGFYLPFTNTTSTSTLVADSSGNANNWTPNNISLTAGSTYDSLTDVPTLTSATVANYAVLNPLQKGGSVNPSSGNLEYLNTATAYYKVFSTIGITSGKWYVEYIIVASSAITNGRTAAGLARYDVSTSNYFGADTYSWGSINTPGNTVLNSNTPKSITTGAFVAGDVLMLAYDADAGKLWFGVKGAWDNGNDPSTGSTPSYSTGLLGSTGPFFFGVHGYTSPDNTAINFGQRPFTYTAPTGFLPLNTFNI